MASSLRHPSCLLPLLLAALRTLFAQPQIFTGGIVNAASYAPASSPGGAIAQGSILSIFGTDLGPVNVAGVQTARFPLETTLAGVSVRLVHLQTGAVLAAIPLFARHDQINAIVPSDTPVGSVAVTVIRDGRTSLPQTVKVVRSSFGVFTHAGSAIVQNFVSPDEQPLNSPASPAVPGQTVILWGTGLGPVALAEAAGPAPGPLNVPIEVTLGGRPVAIDYAGRSGCCAGVDQINFRVPSDTPAGCAVPLTVKVQGGVYGNVATMAVGPGEPPCFDETVLPSGARRWGDITLTRHISDAGTQDMATGFFGAGERPALGFRPAPGNCASGRGVTGGIAGVLDAGPSLVLEGPQGTRQIPRAVGGIYELDSMANPLFLGPGTYTISGWGGSDVGAFRASLVAPAAPSWTTTVGDRSRGITLGWAGGEPQSSLVGISGQGFFCTAVAAAGSVTLPPAVAANLPASSPLTISAASRVPFDAPGLEAARFSYTHSSSRLVTFGEPPLAASPVRLPNGEQVLAELATTNAERQRGLMQRAELAADRGMLFLFDQTGSYSFWMFRTLIPLDIIWLDRQRRIVFISANTPPCASENSANCPVYGGREETQYVLELAAGQAGRQGLRAGDRLDW